MHTHIDIHTYIHICICVCTHLYRYIYVYFTHTHARTFSTASDLTVLPSASSCTLNKKEKNSKVSPTIYFQIISDLTFENESNWLFQTWHSNLSKILKIHLPAECATRNHCRADFWEFSQSHNFSAPRWFFPHFLKSARSYVDYVCMLCVDYVCMLCVDYVCMLYVDYVCMLYIDCVLCWLRYYIDHAITSTALHHWLHSYLDCPPPLTALLHRLRYYIDYIQEMQSWYKSIYIGYIQEEVYIAYTHEDLHWLHTRNAQSWYSLTTYNQSSPHTPRYLPAYSSHPKRGNRKRR